MTAMAARVGLTLFEIGVSLLIMAAVATVSLMALPTGLRAQAKVRSEVLAAAAFQDMLHKLHTVPHYEWGSEGRNPEDRPWLNARCWGADADALRLWMTDRGFKPVPEAIAWRLDSDGDEIARHLAEGGRLFYKSGDHAHRALVFAIVGSSQQEVMRYLPQMRWPYYDYLVMRHQKGAMDETRPQELIWSYGFGQQMVVALPVALAVQPAGASYQRPAYTPGQAGTHANWFDPSDPRYYGIGFDGSVLQQWSDLDPAFGDRWFRDAIHDADEFRRFAKVHPSPGSADQIAKTTRILRYMTLTRVEWEEGFAADPPPGWTEAESVADFNAARSDPTAPVGDADTVQWLGLATMRLERALVGFLRGTPVLSTELPLTPVALAPLEALLTAPPADEAAIRALYDADPLRTVVLANLLRYYAYLCGVHSSDDSRLVAMNNPAAFTDRIRRFQATHDLALRLNRWLQRHRPYDLRTVRDITHPLMTDHLLVQHDVFGTPLADPSIDASAISHAWDYLTAHPIQARRSESRSLPKTEPETWVMINNVFEGGGVGIDYDTTWTPPGNPPVHPGAGSASLEAMRTSLSVGDGWHQRWNLTNRFQASERSRQFVAWQVDWQSYTDAETAIGAPTEAAHVLVQFNENRGPAHPSNVRMQSFHGWDIHPPDALSSFEGSGMLNVTYKYATGTGPGLNSNSIDINRYFGWFGSDRNRNERLDRGNLQTSMRLRAVTVNRFDFYDPRGLVPIP